MTVLLQQRLLDETLFERQQCTVISYLPCTERAVEPPMSVFGESTNWLQVTAAPACATYLISAWKSSSESLSKLSPAPTASSPTSESRWCMACLSFIMRAPGDSRLPRPPSSMPAAGQHVSHSQQPTRAVPPAAFRCAVAAVSKTPRSTGCCDALAEAGSTLLAVRAWDSVRPTGLPCRGLALFVVPILLAGRWIHNFLPLTVRTDCACPLPPCTRPSHQTLSHGETYGRLETPSWLRRTWLCWQYRHQQQQRQPNLPCPPLGLLVQVEVEPRPLQLVGGPLR